MRWWDGREEFFIEWVGGSHIYPELKSAQLTDNQHTDTLFTDDNLKHARSAAIQAGAKLSLGIGEMMLSEGGELICEG